MNQSVGTPSAKETAVGRVTTQHALTSSIAVQVRQVEAAVRDALQPLLGEHGLTLEHWRILAVIDDEPGLGMSEIATAAVVPAASLTRHMDRLVERGLVVRRADPHDGRRAVVALSPRGQSYAARLHAAERAIALPTLPFD